ncbi:hypothetical protein EG329_014459 [Mollisiaceae sp. DMI_Dod_QoI]|nr:hypothetical protein EG329_014459 [Helotiales sp. DMI_Dod_QoI]
MKTHLEKSSARVDIQIFTASSMGLDEKSPPENQRNLPTYINVVSGLKKITSESSRGDFVYVHFSGHGTAVEPSGQFSNGSTGELALVLLEGTNGTNIRYLRGEDLAGLLQDMVEKELVVTVVLDCCFSGSVMRNDDSVRFLPYDSAIDLAYPPIFKQGSSLGDHVIPTAYRSASMSPNWLINPHGYTILAACGPTEIAHEMGVNGTMHGALSYFLIRTFTRYGRVGGKHQHIYSRLCARFRESWQRQAPMLYGNKSLGFFEDSKYALDSIQIPIIKNRSGSLQLEAGKAHAISEGDRFALCDVISAKSESRSREDPVILEVTQVSAFTSDLKLVDATDIPTLSGLTAIALTCLYLRRFSVCLDLRLPGKDIWDVALQERRSLNIVHTGSTKLGSSFSFYVTVSTKDCYEIRDESNQRIVNLPDPLYDLEQNADYLLDIVDHLLRFKLVKGLATSCLTGPAHPFNELFTVHLINAAGKIFYPGSSHLECLIEVKHGDVVTLVVQNKAEEGGQSLHVHLYSMGSDWEIENLLRGDYDVIPSRGSNKSKDFQLGTDGQWKKNIKMTVPRELRDKGFHYCDDIFKVFLTARPTSFIALELPELGNMIRRRAISRGDDEQHPRPLSEDWAALNFHIRTHFK